MSKRLRLRRTRKLILAAMGKFTDIAGNLALQEMQNANNGEGDGDEGGEQDGGMAGIVGQVADTAIDMASEEYQMPLQLARSSINFAYNSYNKVKNEMRAEEMIKANDVEVRAADEKHYRELETTGTAGDARQEAIVARAEYDARTDEGKKIEEAAKPRWWKGDEIALWAGNKFLGKDYKTPEGQSAFSANEAAKGQAMARMERDHAIEKKKAAEEGIEFTKLPGRGSAEEKAALAAAEEKARRAEAAAAGQEEGKAHGGRAGCGCSKEQQGAWAHERNRRSQQGEHADDAGAAANARRNSDAPFARRVNARTGAAGAARLATLAQMSAAGDSRLLGQSIIDLHQTVKAQGRQMHEATTRKNYSRS